MSTVGYTRSYAQGEDMVDEVVALRAAGARRVHVETSPTSIVVLSTMLADAATGDTVVVTSLERLASGVAGITRALADMNQRQVRLQVLDTPDLDIARPDAVALLTALRDAARGQRSESTKRGLARTGKPLGRPPVLTSEDVAIAAELRRHDRSIAHIARVLGVSASAVQRALRGDI